jgi:hypothetical protein
MFCAENVSFWDEGRRYRKEFRPRATAESWALALQLYNKVSPALAVVLLLCAMLCLRASLMVCAAVLDLGWVDLDLIAVCAVPGPAQPAGAERVEHRAQGGHRRAVAAAGGVRCDSAPNPAVLRVRTDIPAPFLLCGCCY